MREPLTRFLVLYLLSGAAGLLFEVAWLRRFALDLGHTVGAASTVLATVMGGFAAGAALGGRLAPRLTPSGALRAYAALELLTAAAALAVPGLLEALDPLLRWTYRDGGGGLLFGVGRGVASAGRHLEAATWLLQPGGRERIAAAVLASSTLRAAQGRPAAAACRGLADGLEALADHGGAARLRAQ